MDASRSVDEAPGRPSIGFWRAALHLGALWALAFVQPLLGLLGGSAEFFVARGNTTFDIVVLALGFGLVPPLLFAGLVWLAGRAGLGWPVHLTLVALLVAVLVLPPLGDLLGGSVIAIAVAIAVGAGGAVLYARAGVVRSFLTALSPAPLVFVAIFLFGSGASELVTGGEAAGAAPGPARSSTPIVHIVLDELPTSTLANADGEVDAGLFPNLARFAADATWYRNATTVADTTSEAVPAQVTGDLPVVGALPTPTDHPNSLFSLFARSHELSVVEPITDICPARLCPEGGPSTRARLSALAKDLRVVIGHLTLPADLREDLPSIDRGWLGFEADTELAGVAEGGGRGKLLGRVIERLGDDDAESDFARMTAAIEEGSGRPPLVFMHSTLPHGPARFLPDGRGYPINRTAYPGFAEGRWTDRQWLVDHSFQRHVLQAQYTDVLVGRLLDALREADLYDDAVIVITADHGISFHAGHPRRRLDPVTMPDLVVVPFFVKLPGQDEGSVSDAAVRTIDALPTIAKAAGVSVPWETDGMPADERSVDPDASIAALDDGKAGDPMPLGDLLEGVAERKEAEAVLLRDGVYSIGPRPDLVGEPVPGDAPAGTGSATIDDPDAYGDIGADDEVVPALVTGDVTGLEADDVIAIGVNGRVEATTRVFPGRDGLEFSALVRPASLVAGENAITVLEVPDQGGLRRIGPE